MRIPDALASLAEYGILDEVLRPLMSGKEAQVYLVRAGGELRVAKVYKEAQNRTFKNRADYTEGRKVRNTRDQRAMGKGSRHGRAQTEAAWRTTEVEMIYRLRDAGVRVPTPYHFIDGVLVMEMITDEHGEPAPRLGDVILELDGAQAVFDRLLAEVVRMLSAGVVHGDLSDFNVLMGTDGPVIIDFPQAVDASSNQNARKLLLRDVDNLHRYMARFAPERRALPYAQEMWALYERGQLTPDAKLTGRHHVAERKVSTEAVLGLIKDAASDERRRRENLGLGMRGVAADPAHAKEDAQAAPRPLSRYAQKREALIAARKLEAQNKPPQQHATQHARSHAANPARPAHGNARHQAPRDTGRRGETTVEARPAAHSAAKVAAHPRAAPRPHSAAPKTAAHPRPPQQQRADHGHVKPGEAGENTSGGARKRRRRRRKAVAGA
jgi:RIO kinase 1